MRTDRKEVVSMIYGNAMLGETPELFKETEEWTKAEIKKLEKNEKKACIFKKGMLI